MLTPEVFTFLKDLKENNEKEWFHGNKKRYQQARSAYEDFINLVIAGIAVFDPTIKTLQAKDCMFRINRDIRFSNDKSPYKTNFGAYISQTGRKGPYAGYYVHVEPGGCFLAGGIYMPEPPVLLAIRKEIAFNPAAFKEIINNPAYKKEFGQLYGEKLKNPPKGFDKDFPDIELLKYKQYTAYAEKPDSFFQQQNTIEQVLKSFNVLYSLNRYLNEVVLDVYEPGDASPSLP